MHRACIALLAGCGFQSSAGTGDPGDPMVDAMVDAPGSGAKPVACWKITDTVTSFRVSACPTALINSIVVMMDVSVDTDLGKPNPPGLSCAPLSAGDDNICVLAANSITIEQGNTLLAHGTRPLALLGHSITINGTVDVASHIVGGQRGPASNLTGCNPGTAANNAGGGAGGTFVGQGGKGGEEGGSPITTGGAVGNTIGFTRLRGGCDGGRNGTGQSNGGPAMVGGAGGGAVWIASDMGTLVIGSGAKINASGASGAGGAGSAAVDSGGYGGGSGGLIVLQAPTITLDASAQIFANGGHGGGGAQSAMSGHNGIDPTGAASIGGGGDGGKTAAVGAGGSGYPASAATLNGANGDAPTHSGGGGGGGGAGAIRVIFNTTLSGQVSPPAVQMAP